MALAETMLIRGTYNTKIKFSFEINTVGQTGNSHPFETSVRHRAFNRGKWIIIGWSSDNERAIALHNYYVKYFLNNNITEITDISTNITYTKAHERFELIRCKSVRDCDGSYTDYVLYKDNLYDIYFTMFGDAYLYDVWESEFEINYATYEEAIKEFEEFNGFKEEK